MTVLKSANNSVREVLAVIVALRTRDIVPVALAAETRFDGDASAQSLQIHTAAF